MKVSRRGGSEVSAELETMGQPRAVMSFESETAEYEDMKEVRKSEMVKQNSASVTNSWKKVRRKPSVAAN